MVRATWSRQCAKGDEQHSENGSCLAMLTRFQKTEGRTMRTGSQRLIWLAVGVACATAAAAFAAWAPSSASGSLHDLSWVKVWSGSFAGPAGSGINPKYWRYDTGYGKFGDGEAETMTSSPGNVHVDGHGDLDITALDQGFSWTSGRIQSVSDFGAPAGGEMRVSASIEQPSPADGLGYWPAFWMLGPGSWPEHGEIDILEDVNELSDHSGAFHCGNLTQTNPSGTLGPCHEYTGLSSGLLACLGCLGSYQTYSVIVDRRNPADEQIRWYLDDREYFSLSESQVGATSWDQAVNHGFSMILDVAIGGRYPDAQCGCTTPTSQTSSRGTMQVRDVAVYYR
jgi:beta-glucanase (GH16 family)